MNKKTFLPIILGSDENAYGNARLFIEAFGVRPTVICSFQLIPTRESRIFDVITVKDFDKTDIFEKELLSIINEKRKDYEKIVVVPCSDYYTNLLSELSCVFGEYIENKFIPYDLLCQLNTKDKFYSLCDKYGIDYPKTIIAAADKRESALDGVQIEFPIVVKPENSNATEYLHCKFKGKKKVFFFNSKNDYLSMIKEMNTSGYSGKLIIQEFIPGGDDDMRVINTYSGNDGKTKAVCLGQPVLEEYHPSTLGNYAAIISKNDPLICSKIAAFLDELHYVGFANFDLKLDRRTGKYMMFEINCRTGRSSYFVHTAGLNMMKIMTEDAVFNKSPEKPVFSEKEALWSAVPKGVLLKYVKNPSIKKQIKRLWKSKSFERTLFNPQDMSFKRRLTVYRYYLGYFKSYSKYFFDKNNINFKY